MYYLQSTAGTSQPQAPHAGSGGAGVLALGFDPARLVLSEGISARNLSAALNIHPRTVLKLRKRLLAAGETAPALSAMTRGAGLWLAQQRGSSQLGYWSRLAVLDYKKRRMTDKELAELFCCSVRTINRIVTHQPSRYSILAIAPRKTKYQQSPPAMGWGKKQKNQRECVSNI